MRERERINALLSLIISFFGCALLAIYLFGCINPDHSKQWVGQWQDEYSEAWKFRRDGTYENKHTHGTYAVDKTTFRLIPNRHYVLSGTWERVADKLILYVDNPEPPQTAIVLRRLN